MKSRSSLIIAALLALAASPAFAQQNKNIRGLIESFDGQVVTIATNEGPKVKVAIPEGVNVAITKPFTLAEIQPGMNLGVTTVTRADGAVIAIDVRPIAATTNLGLSAYDLRPGSTMTNAAVEATVASSNGPELTLNYKTGTVKVIVPPEATLSRSAPGTRADLKAGETIFMVAKSEGEQMTAVRLQVSKDGLKPTQ
jgi:hypothetical protein